MTDAIRAGSIREAARSLAGAVGGPDGTSPGGVEVAVRALAATTDASPGEAVGYELRYRADSGDRSLGAVVLLAGVDGPGAVDAGEVRARVENTFGIRGWDGVAVREVVAEVPPDDRDPASVDAAPAVLVRVAVDLP